MGKFKQEDHKLTFRVSEDILLELPEEDVMYFSERKITKAKPVVLVFSVEEDGRIEKIGFVEFDLRVLNRNAYITYYVSPVWRGRGLGKLMLKKAFDFAFRELNLHRITAEVYEYNERSLKLLEGLGFHREGILKEAKYHDGRYWDIIILGMLRENWKDR
ncbi:GNAT family N-acetyltransferase [Fervidobacterium islandicum]|uniref:GNAT family N-acetyltransferase n=1 Tax=Fervidobacterium islandicum TaxID=2423 RepID=A0AAI8CM81_FERIS|nr:GNAT family protein [Fervidobacterium islandicum]AMW32946.1 GNAT family N-acetyltransferase [Fervidobacterium islandicum]